MEAFEVEEPREPEIVKLKVKRAAPPPVPQRSEVCCPPELATTPACSTLASPKAQPLTPPPPPPRPSAPPPIETQLETIEKLYVSVDTHTDSTVVESRAMQTLKDDQKAPCCSATQTQPSSIDSFHSAKSTPASPTPIRKTSYNDKKRTYSITSQRLSDDAIVEIDKPSNDRVRYRSTKSPKCETSCEPGRPCSPPANATQLTTTVPKKNRGKP